ncbi:hypothetical protein Efla_006290 [Eimeria flavescens]
MPHGVFSPEPANATSETALSTKYEERGGSPSFAKAAATAAGPCVKHTAAGCLQQLAKAQSTAALLCGPKSPIYALAELKGSGAADADACRRRQDAAACARQFVARCLHASLAAKAKDATSAFAAAASVYDHIQLSCPSGAGSSSACTCLHGGAAAAVEPQQQPQPAWGAPPSSDARTEGADCSPFRHRPEGEACLGMAAAEATAKATREKTERAVSTLEERPPSKKAKWIESYERLSRQCRELTNEIHCDAAKAQLPRWQRQAVCVASLSSHLNHEKVVHALARDIEKIRLAVSMMRLQTCTSNIDFCQARALISETLLELKHKWHSAVLRLEEVAAAIGSSRKQATKGIALKRRAVADSSSTSSTLIGSSAGSPPLASSTCEGSSGLLHLRAQLLLISIAPFEPIAVAAVAFALGSRSMSALDRLPAPPQFNSSCFSTFETATR